MKIKTWIKYDEGYLPTPRCRKLRYREKEEYVDVELKEISKSELSPAFDIDYEDRYHSWDDCIGITYAYNDKLWVKAKETNLHCPNKKNPMTALEALIYGRITYSTYFGRYDYIDGKYGRREGREDVIKRAESDMDEFLLVDDELYTTTAEPVYCIYTFGLGHNHGGIGTSLSIDRHYNPNISNSCYFNVLHYDEAVKEALNIAERRGDTDSFDYIKETPRIKVFDEKYVKRNPQKDHGEGNSFLNGIESVIEGSSDSVEAGLLTMALTASVTK